MTEEEWLECTIPTPMIDWLGQDIVRDDRKLRLFALACCQRILHLMTDARSRLAVEVADRFVEGRASSSELDNARTNATLVNLDERNGAISDAVIAASLVSMREVADSDGTLSTIDSAWAIAGSASQWAAKAAARSAGYYPERLVQCQFLRDIFGPLPFRPITLDPRWLTSTVVDVAQAIYDERAFDRLPILADALMDAGCDSEEIIRHCRSEGTHVRGCWVIHQILGKG